MKRDFSLLVGKHFDLLVCGGGIYGAWTAYDAALSREIGPARHLPHPAS
jgi:glycerol-3-phosphate dehydrogenase